MILPPLPVPLVLASASPRRRELLELIGLDFQVLPAQVEENLPDGSPTDGALTLAKRKAAAVAQQKTSSLIIAADTIVTIDSQVLGKPRDLNEAREMLQLLAGRWHTVITGLVLQQQEQGLVLQGVESTRVHVKPLEPEELEAYLAEGTALDKAGAYAIQGSFGLFVDRIEGCYYNVVGLPLALLGELYKKAAHTLADLLKSRAKSNVDR